jgi:hypothetical protein
MLHKIPTQAMKRMVEVHRRNVKKFALPLFWQLKCCTDSGACGRNMTSTGEKKLTYLIHYIKPFYKFCTFNVICNDNSAINCITVHHKKVSLQSTLMGHTLGY